MSFWDAVKLLVNNFISLGLAVMFSYVSSARTNYSHYQCETFLCTLFRVSLINNFSSLDGGNRHLSQPCLNDGHCFLQSFQIALWVASGDYLTHMHWSSTLLNSWEESSEDVLCSFSVQLPPLWCSVLRIVGAVVSKESLLCLLV